MVVEVELAMEQREQMAVLEVEEGQVTELLGALEAKVLMVEPLHLLLFLEVEEVLLLLVLLVMFHREVVELEQRIQLLGHLLPMLVVEDRVQVLLLVREVREVVEQVLLAHQLLVQQVQQIRVVVVVEDEVLPTAEAQAVLVFVF